MHDRGLTTPTGIRHSRFQSAGRHEFCDQHNALPALGGTLPGVVKADNVGMLQPLQHARLLLEALPLRL